MDVLPLGPPLSAADIPMARLALALAIGLMVGLERGWREREAPEGSRTAGLRTFGLTGLLGGVAGALTGAVGDGIVLATAFLAFTGVFAAFAYREAVHDGNFSVTSVVAALAVFALGALSVLGDLHLAAAGGAVVAALLASRVAMHGLLRRMRWPELRSAVLLGAMTTIGLPLMPDRALDPWGGLNLRELWFMTVLTATISFVGYIAVRLFGPSRGLLVSGLAGGLVSSTVTVAALSRAAHDGRLGPQRAAAAGLACLVSAIRIAALTALLAPPVLSGLMPALAPACLALGLAGGAVLLRAPASAPAGPDHANPFDLPALLAFSALLGAVSLTGAVLSDRFGTATVIATSALSGLVDLDIAALSALRMVGTAITPEQCARAILAAVAVNTVVRITLAMTLGPRRFWLPFATIMTGAVVAGLAGLLIMAGARVGV